MYLAETKSTMLTTTEAFLPLSDLDVNRMVSFTRRVAAGEEEAVEAAGGFYEYRAMGLLSREQPSLFHPYMGFNKFARTPLPVPPEAKGWRMDKDDNEEDGEAETPAISVKGASRLRWLRWWTKHYVDPTARVFQPPVPHPLQLHKQAGATLWKTADNGGIGFVIAVEIPRAQLAKDGNTGTNSDIKVNNNHTQADAQPEAYLSVHIYGRTTDVVLNGKESEYEQEPFQRSELDEFVNLVKTYQPLEVYVGQSVRNKMTEFSGGHGPRWDGNSFLLRIPCPADQCQSKFWYAHVGAELFEFGTDEPITAYYSSVGNNADE